MILSHLKHPYICELFEILDHESSVFLVMEYQTSDLYYYLGKHSVSADQGLVPTQCQLIMGQLANAIAYCHSYHIAHLDIKPENVLINELGTQVRLIDFGFSTGTTELLEQFSGSVYYAAPELLCRKK